MTQRWMVDWSSATASGNDLVEFPDHLLRSQVISRWESAHRGCYVDRLTSRGGGHEETRMGINSGTTAKQQ